MVSRPTPTPTPPDPSEPPRGPVAGEAEVFILTREAVRELDHQASTQYGIPSIVLMENAAIHIAEVALHVLGGRADAGVLIVCGPGNNGGDGLAAARHLHNAGVHVHIVLAAPEAALAGDAAVNLQIVKKMGLAVQVEDTLNPGRALREAAAGFRPELIIDAVLGTGVRERVREPLAGTIAALNRAARDGKIPVLSIDLPSGLDCDTGEPLGGEGGGAVNAAVTVSLVGLKHGFTTLAAQSYVGDVVVVDIGAPRELTERLGTRLKEQELPDRFVHPSQREHREDSQRQGDGGGGGEGEGGGGAAKRLGDG